MCTVLFAWMVRQDYFKEITDTDIRERLYNERMKQFDEQMLPLGFQEDGIQDNEQVDNFNNDHDRWIIQKDRDFS